MIRRPSQDIRQLFDVARQQPTTTAAHEVADRAAASLSWMQGYLRNVEEAIKTGDVTTFVDSRRELQFARNEIAALFDLLREVHEWLAQQQT